MRWPTVAREVFAIAVQDLVWGAAQPFAGGLADLFGAGRVLLAGAALYGAGLLVMACATSPGLRSSRGVTACPDRRDG